MGLGFPPMASAAAIVGRVLRWTQVAPRLWSMCVACVASDALIGRAKPPFPQLNDRHHGVVGSDHGGIGGELDPGCGVVAGLALVRPPEGVMESCPERRGRR